MYDSFCHQQTSHVTSEHASFCHFTCCSVAVWPFTSAVGRDDVLGFFFPAESGPSGCSLLHEHASDFQVEACKLKSTVITWLWQGQSSLSLWPYFTYQLQRSPVACRVQPESEENPGSIFLNGEFTSSHCSQSTEAAHQTCLCACQDEFKVPLFGCYAQQWARRCNINKPVQ